MLRVKISQRSLPRSHASLPDYSLGSLRCPGMLRLLLMVDGRLYRYGEHGVCMRRLSFPAFQWGLTFGIVIAVAIFLANIALLLNPRPADSLASTAAAAASVSAALTLGGVLLLMEAVGLLLAGFVTARQAGMVKAGIGAGLIAGLSGSVIGFLSALLLATNDYDPLAHVMASRIGALSPVVGVGDILLALGGLALLVVFWMLIAALGALIGRRFYRAESEDYREGYGLGYDEWRGV